MNPPKCPACGHEHWQIEGCGPAEVKTEINIGGRWWTREEVTPSAMRPLAFDITETPEILGQNALASHEAIPPEDLAAFDAAQTEWARIAEDIQTHGAIPLTGLAASLPISFSHVGMSGDGVSLLSTSHPVGASRKRKRPALSKNSLETVEINVPPHAVPENRVLRRVRRRLNLTQPAFSAQFSIALGTLRGWESGRHKIPPYVMVLLRIIEANPKAVFQALGVKP